MGYQRHTTGLSRKQCKRLEIARIHANEIGRPLNFVATIHWAMPDGSGLADKRWQKLIELTRHWFSRRAADFTCVWVMEMAEGGKGLHTHLAFNLPDQIDADELEDYWRDRLGRVYENVLDFGPVDEGIYGGRGWQRYMFKEASTKTRKLYGVPDKIKKFRAQYGLVVGKRAGFTQNLGPAAIDRYLQAQKQDAAVA